MDALEAIHTRRSVRKYQDSPVSEELIRKIIAAAAMAPSAATTQATRYRAQRVNTDSDILPS